jgi:hypothetical protein
MKNEGNKDIYIVGQGLGRVASEGLGKVGLGNVTLALLRILSNGILRTAIVIIHFPRDR